MGYAEALGECSSDVLTQVTESLQIYSGLLTVAIVFGVFFGLVAGALLYVYYLKPVFLSRKFQGYDPRRLFDMDEGDKDESPSERASTTKRAMHGATHFDKDKKQQPAMNSDVAAFALKAKVVYPINQRYRPLADGASNPSLHEHSKHPALPARDSSSSSSMESLSQGKEEDDDGEDDNESSQFISNSPLLKALESEKFIRVFSHPETLCYPGPAGRVSLYCLAAQELQQQRTQLQRDKWENFLQILRLIFNESKVDPAFYNNILLTQETELAELRKGLSSELISCERSEDPSALFTTVEEMEKAGRELIQQSMQTTLRFGKQVERLSQYLISKHSNLPKEVAQELISTLIHCLVLMEKHLADCQVSIMKTVIDRVQWWEELSGWLRVKTALLKKEAEIRLRLATQSLEQLTGDGHLSFSHMERILGDLQNGVREELHRLSEDIRRQTKDVVFERVQKVDMKRRKMLKTQARERNRMLEAAPQKPEEWLMMWRELWEKQRKQRADLELQQDGRLSEALCELWKKQHCWCVERVAELCRESFLTALPSWALLPRGHCERLLAELHLKLGAELQAEESIVRQHLLTLRLQLDKDRQAWSEEEALAGVCLKHLSDQQMKVVMAMVVRQRDMTERASGLMEQKHCHLLAAVQRHMAARHFCLRALREMRVSRLKLQPETDLSTHTLQEYLSKDPYPGIATGDLGPEAALIGQGLQQEFLSELETAYELLQGHAQLLMGHALSNSAQLRLDPLAGVLNQTTPWEERKGEMIEAVSESVYVTRDSLHSVMDAYYSELRSIATATLQEQQRRLQSSTEESEQQRDGERLTRDLLKELANWARKPNSSEFYQRVELQKRRVLSLYEQDQHSVYETLRTREAALGHGQDSFRDKLRRAEESFMSRLAAVARMPFGSRESAHTDSQTGTDAALAALTRQESDSSSLRSDSLSHEPKYLSGMMDTKKRFQRRREIF